MKFSFKSSLQWGLVIGIITFFLACIFSITSTIVLDGLAWGLGMLVVLALVLTGIGFDILGMASAAAKETPFHAMASEKIEGSRDAIGIVRNADRFSSFCNDVIGDITGIISGAASTFVVLKLLDSLQSDNALIQTVVTVIFSGAVSALTVGGKAVGKTYAIHYSTEIILFVGKIFYFLEKRLGIRIFNAKNQKANKGKRGNKRVARSD